MARPRKELKDIKFDGIVLNDEQLLNIRASRCGNIKNILTGNILKPYKMKKGHMQVSVSRNGNVKKYLVHRIIALSFIENKDGKPCVNHLNGRPFDNRVENLEWCTDQENKTHAKNNGMFQQSTWRYNSKFNEDQILTIHTLGWSQSKISRHYKTSSSVICNIKNCKTYKNYAVIYEK